MSTDSLFFIFFDKPMLDEDNLAEAQAFKAKNGETRLIDYELIPDDYRAVVVYQRIDSIELSEWTHRLQVGNNITYLVKLNADNTLIYKTILTYEGKIKELNSGASVIRRNKYGLRYFNLIDGDNSNIIYFDEFTKATS